MCEPTSVLINGQQHYPVVNADGSVFCDTNTGFPVYFRQSGEFLSISCTVRYKTSTVGLRWWMLCFLLED